jgi:hypothetical protein
MKVKQKLDILLNMVIGLPALVFILLYAFCIFLLMAPFVFVFSLFGSVPSKEIGEWFRQKIKIAMARGSI